jgi:hypothetical protein
MRQILSWRLLQKCCIWFMINNSDMDVVIMYKKAELLFVQDKFVFGERHLTNFLLS